MTGDTNDEFSYNIYYYFFMWEKTECVPLFMLDYWTHGRWCIIWCVLCTLHFVTFWWCRTKYKHLALKNLILSLRPSRKSLVLGLFEGIFALESIWCSNAPCWLLTVLSVKQSHKNKAGVFFLSSSLLSSFSYSSFIFSYCIRIRMLQNGKEKIGILWIMCKNFTCLALILYLIKNKYSTMLAIPPILFFIVA
jgi:hypothetical protein